MPSGVNYQLLQDVIVDTLRNLPRDEYELMWENPQYHGLQIYQEKKRISDGGKGIQRHVILNPDGNAQYVALFNTKTPNVSSSQKLIFVPWAFFTTNYTWDEREIIMNGPNEVGFINLIKVRRDQSMWGISKLINDGFWGIPTNAADTINPLSIPYWLPLATNGTTIINGQPSSNGGFVGQTIRYADGSTGTIAGGLDAAVEQKWQSFVATYNEVDNALLRTLRIANRSTHFQGSPLVKTKGNENPSFAMTELYSNNDTVTALEDLSDKRDDNSSPNDLAGKMLHNFDGVAHFNRVPIVYIQNLDLQTVTNANGAIVNPNAIYQVNWECMQPYVLEDFWLVEKKPMVQPAQPNLLTVNVDGGHQLICVNRRAVGFAVHNPL